MSYKVLILLFILTITLFGCKKEICFKCRDSNLEAYYVKGADSILVIGQVDDVFIKNLTDSGYLVTNPKLVWNNDYYVICNDDGIKIYHEDSCVRQ